MRDLFSLRGNTLSLKTKVRLLRLAARYTPLLELLRLKVRFSNGYRPHDRVSTEFYVWMMKHLYGSPAHRIVWANIFVPSELFWGLGLIPFYPEVGAAAAVGLGLAPKALEWADEMGVPRDLCTFHRVLAGLAGKDLFPQAGAFVVVNFPCTVAGQVLASEAFVRGSPFFTLDLPSSADDEAVDYLTSQLEDVAYRLAEISRMRYSKGRMREAIRLSNQARAYAVEAMELRKATPSPIRGSDMIGHLGMVIYLFGSRYGVEYYRMLRDYIARLRQEGHTEQEHQRHRLYWMHLKPFYQCDLFHLLENERGGVIAFEEHTAVWWEPLNEEEPFRSLARKMISHPSNGPVERRIEKVLKDVEDFRVDGVIHFNHWGCRQSQGALSVIRRRLRQEGIPLLELDGDCADQANFQEGQVRVRLEAFLESL